MEKALLYWLLCCGGIGSCPVGSGLVSVLSVTAGSGLKSSYVSKKYVVGTGCYQQVVVYFVCMHFKNVFLELLCLVLVSCSYMY